MYQVFFDRNSRRSFASIDISLPLAGTFMSRHLISRQWSLMVMISMSMRLGRRVYNVGWAGVRRSDPLLTASAGVASPGGGGWGTLSDGTVAAGSWVSTWRLTWPVWMWRHSLWRRSEPTEPSPSRLKHNNNNNSIEFKPPNLWARIWRQYVFTNTCTIHFLFENQGQSRDLCHKEASYHKPQLPFVL